MTTYNCYIILRWKRVHSICPNSIPIPSLNVDLPHVNIVNLTITLSDSYMYAWYSTYDVTINIICSVNMKALSKKIFWNQFIINTWVMIWQLLSMVHFCHNTTHGMTFIGLNMTVVDVVKPQYALNRPWYALIIVYSNYMTLLIALQI